jgi:hemerythrin-like domain-containing protein
LAIQIGAKHDCGFDDPLGMLKDCHRRIQSFLRIFCVVAERAKGRALTDEERAAVDAALNYFRSGGQRHTADEESSLFPRLRASCVDTPSELETLEADHRDAEYLHAEVERLYVQWVGMGELRAEDHKQLLAETGRLGHLYAEHIEIEETIVFVHAAKVLDSQTIAAIGLEFEGRRKLS